MNIMDSLLRAVPTSNAAAVFIVVLVAVAKWRGKPFAARVEHALWTCVLTAMLAFATPRLAIHAGSPIIPTATRHAGASGPPLEIIAESIPNSTRDFPEPRPSPSIWFVLWLAGAGFMAFRILLGVHLTRRSLAGTTLITDENAIQTAVLGKTRDTPEVVESDRASVPMTVGWPGAQIVLPAAWRAWSAEKLNAVLLHELAHVWRRDNFVAFLAAINKAIFWFHPLAWWLERHIAELAEFAADDEVLGNAVVDRRGYAGILVEVASSARSARLLRSASVDFAQNGLRRINRRVDRIFDFSSRAGSRGIVLAAAAGIAMLTFLRLERPVYAQPPEAQATAPIRSNQPASADTPQSVAKPLVFDAASVRPVTWSLQRDCDVGIAGSKDPGRFHCPVASLKELLLRAYNVRFFELDGPGWLDDRPPTFFDIQAAMPPDTTKEQCESMLRNLLAERFGLRIHREKRELPVYSLLVGRGGPKMKEAIEEQITESDLPDRFLMGSDGFPMVRLPHPGTFLINRGDLIRIVARQQTMDEFSKRLAEPLGRTVRDATGLGAKYDFTVTFTAEGDVPQPGDSGTDVRVALQQQLGLRLEPGKGPVDVIVIDHIEKTPTEN